MKVAPSILAANFARLGEEVVRLTDAGADMIHIDVMDGHFVPNLTIGPQIIKSIRDYTDIPFDVHLMISHPSRMLKEFAAAGSDFITIHAEAEIHLHRYLREIKSLGKKAGVSIVPSTPVSAITEILAEVDLVLVMTVNPGFGGQELIPSQLQKVRALKSLRHQFNLDFLISVDGGIGPGNIHLIKEVGADVVVSGTALFKEQDLKAGIEKMR